MFTLPLKAPSTNDRHFAAVSVHWAVSASTHRGDPCGPSLSGGIFCVTFAGMSHQYGLLRLSRDRAGRQPLAIPQKDLRRVRRHGQGIRSEARAAAEEIEGDEGLAPVGQMAYRLAPRTNAVERRLAISWGQFRGVC